MQQHVETCNLIVRSQIVIDRPVEQVWRHFLDMGAWMSGLEFQHLRGTRGAEGEVCLVRAAASESYPSYLIETMRITPLRQYVVKVTPPQGDDYLGFADFSFTQTDAGTHLIYDIYLASRLAAKTAAQCRQLCDQQQAAAQAEVDRNNRNLKRLVEEQPRA